ACLAGAGARAAARSRARNPAHAVRGRAHPDPDCRAGGGLTDARFAPHQEVARADARRAHVSVSLISRQHETRAEGHERGVPFGTAKLVVSPDWGAWGERG